MGRGTEIQSSPPYKFSQLLSLSSTMLLIPDGPQEPCRTPTLDWVPKVVSWCILSVAGTHIAAINFSVLRKEVKKTRDHRGSWEQQVSQSAHGSCNLPLLSP